MSVSVIIPCLNRADELERCLRSFSRVPESEEFNVIVVDDGSAVPLESTVRNHPFAGVVRNEKRQGAARSKNIGAAATNGEWLLFMDSDTEIVNPDSIPAMKTTLRDRPEFGVVGAEFVLRKEWFVPLRTMGLDTRPTITSASGDAVVEVDFVSSSNLMISRTDFERTGGYLESMDYYFEDAELCAAVRRLGKKIGSSPIFAVRHYRSGHERDFFRQVYLVHRNRLFYAWIHHGVRGAFKTMASVALHSFSGMREYPLRMRARRRAMVWLAMASSLAKMPAAFKRRRQLMERQATVRHSLPAPGRAKGR